MPVVRQAIKSDTSLFLLLQGMKGDSKKTLQLFSDDNLLGDKQWPYLCRHAWPRPSLYFAPFDLCRSSQMRIICTLEHSSELGKTQASETDRTRAWIYTNYQRQSTTLTVKY